MRKSRTPIAKIAVISAKKKAKRRKLATRIKITRFLRRVIQAALVQKTLATRATARVVVNLILHCLLVLLHVIIIAGTEIKIPTKITVLLLKFMVSKIILRKKRSLLKM